MWPVIGFNIRSWSCCVGRQAHPVKYLGKAIYGMETVRQNVNFSGRASTARWVLSSAVGKRLKSHCKILKSGGNPSNDSCLWHRNCLLVETAYLV